MNAEILKELVVITGVERVKREHFGKHLEKIINGVGALDEDQWDALSDEAADWYNSAVEALNAGQEIPGSAVDPLDVEAEEQANNQRRNRGTRNSEKGNETMPKTKFVELEINAITKGIKLSVLFDGDTFEGEVTNVTKKGRGKNAKVEEFALDVDGNEEVFGASEFDFEAGDSIKVEEEVKEESKPAGRSRRGAKKDEDTKPAGRGRRGAKKEEPTVSEEEIAFEAIAKGDTLKLTVEEDSFEGEVIEAKRKGRGKNAKTESFVLKTADGEEAFEAENIIVEEGDKIIKVVVSEAKAETKADTKKTTTRRSSRKSSSASKPSAASEVRKLIVHNLDASKADIQALAEEEGIDMKPSTLDVLYSDAHSLIAVLREEEIEL